MSRHPKLKLNRSKAAVLATAGALSLATAASASAATWTQGRPARPDRPATRSEAGPPRPTVTARLAQHIAGNVYRQGSVQLAQRAHQVRRTGADLVRRAGVRHSGSPQQTAEAMLGSFGWSSGQFSCLDPLWAHESGWSVTAYNAGSGAYGIPQALPGARMADAGPDWQTDAATQINWGLEYIRENYGSPCGAWAHEQAAGWY